MFLSIRLRRWGCLCNNRGLALRLRLLPEAFGGGLLSSVCCNCSLCLGTVHGTLSFTGSWLKGWLPAFLFLEVL